MPVADEENGRKRYGSTQESMMKKALAFGCAIIVSSFLLAGLAYSQSLEETKARIRSEVRSEMGIGDPGKPDVRQKGERDGSGRTGLQIIHQLALIAMAIALIPATIAKVKGRSFIAWWVLGMVCFVVVFPVSVFMKKV